MNDIFWIIGLKKDWSPKQHYFFLVFHLGMPRGTRGTRSLRSPAIFPRPVPRWLEFSTPSPPPSPATIPRVSPKSNYFDNCLHFHELFYKKMRDSHYIWLSFKLILSIPHYFVTSNHENHIILLISKKNCKKNSFQ